MAAAAAPDSSSLASNFIEQVFQKRECAYFIPSPKDKSRCGCGRVLSNHILIDEKQRQGLPAAERWTISKHTAVYPTDAYGTIEFQGGPHPYKAQYVRLGFDSEPDQILYLFEKIWALERPKLVISVHGGMTNFNLQPKLARVFRKGLLKAAKTTGAWIITSGMNTGVVRHVASALSDGGGIRTKKKIVTIGIAPWGLLKRRDDLVGADVTVPYHPQAFAPKNRFAVLSDKHSFFLLVDNGTVGRYGADIILRKRFEEFISKQTLEGTGKRIPVVCVVLEGGTCTIRAVLDYVTNVPPVPVVVCDGSGRAADLLAFAHKYLMDDGSLPDQLRPQLVATIQDIFEYNSVQANKILMEVLLCVRKKDLITVFRLGEDSNQDIDHAILTALLKGQNLSLPDQLSLALTWNRVDIARTDIFQYGQEWPPGSLEIAMMDALIYDRVEFVKLLLENGVSMEKFLTIPRLEDLYNTDRGPSYSPETLRLLLSDCVKYNVLMNHHYNLHEIGLVIERLMGGGYLSIYGSKEFKRRYQRLHLVSKSPPNVAKLTSVKTKASLSPSTKAKMDEEEMADADLDDEESHFRYPFNELLLWSVLMRRQKMALCMWQHGEEALAKALVACRLYKAMSKEAAEDYLEVEICEEFKQYSDEFKKLGIELLEQCYSTDDDLTFQLLTYELKNWGKQTCISLAVAANHKEFLAHPCCQILLADLWHGGMRIRKHANLRVLIGLLIPPTILSLEFKTKDELLLQPQTKEEHFEDIRDRDQDSGLSMDSRQDSDVEGGADQSDDSENESPARRRRLKSTVSRKSSLNASASHLPGVFMKSPGAKRQFSRSNENLPPVEENEPSLLKAQSGLRLFNLGGAQEYPALKEAKRIEQQRSLRIGKRIYEFYVAPITTFWFFTISYVSFLAAFTYIVLIRTQLLQPTIAEYYVIVWIVTYGCEKIRKLLMADAHTFSQKLKVFCERQWNVGSSIAVLTFLIAVVLRFSPSQDTMMIGRVFYCMNIVYWYMRVLDLLSVNKYLGPYITMVGKMVINMIQILTILTIVTMSFGIIRQSVLFPYNEWRWQLLRDVFMKPYFMLYGEVYAPEIDTCGDEAKDCVPGGWITPAFMAAFLLVANILLINLLIASFNHIFMEVNNISHQVWKFQRYNVVMEYEQKPWLPPPLIIIPLLYLVGKYFYRRCWQRKRFHFDNALKLFLSSEDVEKLHDFEEECMDDYFRQREIKSIMSTDERIRRTNDRVEFLSMKLDDVLQRQNLARQTVQQVDLHLERMEMLMRHCLNAAGLPLPNENEEDETIEIEDESLITAGGGGGARGIFTDMERLLSQTNTARLPQPARRTMSNLERLKLQRQLSQLPKRKQSSSAAASAASIPSVSSTAVLSGVALHGADAQSLGSVGSLSLNNHAAAGVGGQESSTSSPNLPPKVLLRERPGRRSHSATPVATMVPMPSPLASPELKHRAAAETLSSPEEDADRLTMFTVPSTRDDSELTSTSVCAKPVSSTTTQQNRQGGQLRQEPLSLRIPERTPQDQTRISPKSAGVALAASDTSPQAVPRLRSTTLAPMMSTGRRSSLKTAPSLGGRKPTLSTQPSSSIHRSMEYTSITDCITTADSDYPQGDQPQHPPTLVTVLDSGVPSVLGVPSVGPKRAKWSFVNLENQQLKEIEEVASAITGSMLQDRMRGTDAKNSVCLLNAEELKEMGLGDLELNDYESAMMGKSQQVASSQESISSAKIEDEEGFQQINECIVMKNLEKLQPTGRVEGKTDASAAVVASSTVVSNQLPTFCVDHLTSELASGAKKKRPSNKQKSAASSKLQRSLALNVPSSGSSLETTGRSPVAPAPSPGVAFGFEAKDIEELMRQAQEEQKRLLRKSEEDD